MNDETTEVIDEGREYSLDELSKQADVTPRTVRYYIVEGLLPPPLTAGRNATYSQEHLDRLNAISAMKEMFLPLREIRGRLNRMTPEQMRDPEYLASISQAAAVNNAFGNRMGRQARHHSHDAMHHHDRRRGGPFVRPETPQPEASTSQTWDRIPLSDDAELLIRSSKAQHMGPRLHRALHQLRHALATEDTNERTNE